VPTFYDSIEVSRDRMVAKYHRREARWNPFFAFVATFFEAIFTLLLLRFFYRLAVRGWSRIASRGGRGGIPPATVPGTDD